MIWCWVEERCWEDPELRGSVFLLSVVEVPSLVPQSFRRKGIAWTMEDVYIRDSHSHQERLSLADKGQKRQPNLCPWVQRISWFPLGWGCHRDESCGPRAWDGWKWEEGSGWMQACFSGEVRRHVINLENVAVSEVSFFFPPRGL